MFEILVVYICSAITKDFISIFLFVKGPTDLIINDFMRMLWEQNVGTVVMVTNLLEDNKVCYQGRYNCIEAYIFPGCNYALSMLIFGLEMLKYMIQS